MRNVPVGPTAMDEESRKGQFGWFEVTDEYFTVHEY